MSVFINKVERVKNCFEKRRQLGNFDSIGKLNHIIPMVTLLGFISNVVYWRYQLGIPHKNKPLRKKGFLPDGKGVLLQINS